MVDKLYESIIKAGTYMAPSIKIAEAAKVIENTQRDVNIGLVNELAVIFDILDIDTEEVLKAAGTKWNFLNFRPGLVGGHCIGVDPYYLTYKSQSHGYHPEMILAGRRINDSMSGLVVKRLMNEFTKRDIDKTRLNVLILGLTFKENCPDLRNSKVINLAEELIKNNINVDCFDPWVKRDEAKKLSINLINKIQEDRYDGIILAVAHDKYIDMGIQKIKSFGNENCIVFDLKYIFNSEDTDIRL